MGKTYNMGRAQAQVIASGLMQRLGTQPEKIVLDNSIQRIIYEYMNQTVEDLKKSIEDKKLTASGNLSGSIEPPEPVYVDANGVYKLKFNMADYWDDVENGQPKGTVVSVQALMEWISNKPIKIRMSNKQSAKSVIAKRKSLAFAIAKTIYKKGTIKRFDYKGSKFLTEVITDESLRDLTFLIAEITGQTVAYSIKTVFESEKS